MVLRVFVVARDIPNCGLTYLEIYIIYRLLLRRTSLAVLLKLLKTYL